MATCAYKPGELFHRPMHPMLARLNQEDEEESNSSLEAGIDHSFHPPKRVTLIGGLPSLLVNGP